MTDLDALLAGIVAHPHEAVRWLIVADWLDDHGQSERAELLRLHRMMIDTCCEPDLHPERAAWQTRIVELIDQGVTPCVPQHTLMLPGGVPLVGNFIPPGSFLMGSEVRFFEAPVVRETVATGFFLGVTPVTQAQWVAVLGANPSHFVGDALPVDSVSWYAARRFCAGTTELTGCAVRLPTEGEWEYACRAGTTTHYHFGDVPDVNRMNYCGQATWNGSVEGENRDRTTAVETFATNPWGLFDLHGNVWEVCSDAFGGQRRRRLREVPESDPYRSADVTEKCVSRGGAWNYEPIFCRSANRSCCNLNNVDPSSGFRVAFTLG